MPITLKISKLEKAILSLLAKGSKTLKQVADLLKVDEEKISYAFQLLEEKNYIKTSPSNKEATVIQDALNNIHEIGTTLVKVMQKLHNLIEEEFKKKGYTTVFYSFLTPDAMTVMIKKEDKEYSINIDLDFS